MRHRKTGLMLLRERADKLAAKNVELEKQLREERFWQDYCQRQTEKYVNKEIDRLWRAEYHAK